MRTIFSFCIPDAWEGESGSTVWKCLRPGGGKEPNYWLCEGVRNCSQKEFQPLSADEVGCAPTSPRQSSRCGPGRVPEKEHRMGGTQCQRAVPRLVPASHAKGISGVCPEQSLPRGTTIGPCTVRLPAASAEPAAAHLLLLLVNGCVHARPSLGANLRGAGAAGKGQILSCPHLSLALLLCLASPGTGCFYRS